MIAFHKKSAGRMPFAWVWIILLVLAGGALPGCAGDEQTSPSQAKSGGLPPDCSDLFSQALDSEVYESGLTDFGQELKEPLKGASRYAIQVSIAKDYQSLSGCELVRYTNREAVALVEVYFLLFPNQAGGAVTVDGVRVGGEAVEPLLERQTSLRIPLAAALQPGETVDLWVAFTVNLPEEPGGNYGLLGFSENVLLLNNFYPVIPVYDDEGWNLEPPPPYGDTTYLDASYYLVQVTAPEKLVLASSGMEIAREVESAQQMVLVAAGPARDFYLAGSTRAQVFSLQSESAAVRVFAGKNYQEAAGRIAQYAADALDIFSSRFGEYPYRELDLVVAPILSLGMEYPGAILLTTELVAAGSEISNQQENILEAVVAHEVAHQWFYNLVGNDQVDEPWMDEAFAQYATYLYYLDRYGESAASSYRGSWNERWNWVGKEKLPIGLSSGEYGENEYVAIIYGRGPLFLQALEKVMGEAVFEDFLQAYINQTAWDIATSDAFRQLAQEHCQCDLGAIFQEWVYP